MSFFDCSMRPGLNSGHVGRSMLPIKPLNSTPVKPCCLAKSRILSQLHAGQPSVENEIGIFFGAGMAKEPTLVVAVTAPTPARNLRREKPDGIESSPWSIERRPCWEIEILRDRHQRTVTCF